LLSTERGSCHNNKRKPASEGHSPPDSTSLLWGRDRMPPDIHGPLTLKACQKRETEIRDTYLCSTTRSPTSSCPRCGPNAPHVPQLVATTTTQHWKPAHTTKAACQACQCCAAQEVNMSDPQAFAGAPVPLSAISNAARSKTALKHSRTFSKSSQVHRVSRQRSASGCPINRGGRRLEWKNRGKEERRNGRTYGKVLVHENVRHKAVLQLSMRWERWLSSATVFPPFFSQLTGQGTEVDSGPAGHESCICSNAVLLGVIDIYVILIHQGTKPLARRGLRQTLLYFKYSLE
jgi:hypothetical protein